MGDKLLGLLLRQFLSRKIAQDHVNCVGDVTAAVSNFKYVMNCGDFQGLFIHDSLLQESGSVF